MSSALSKKRPGIFSNLDRIGNLPWWVFILVVSGLYFFYAIITAPKYSEAFRFLLVGLKLTVTMSLLTFGIAVLFGLIAGLCRVSKNPIVYTISTLYVSVVRGIPMLVLILYFAFVGMPLLVNGLNSLGKIIIEINFPWVWLKDWAIYFAELSIRDVDMLVRGVAALAFSYGAFEAENIRAGIQAISKGQMEAARSLGMSYFQAMRVIILPQALRIVIPPMSNDFIAVVKDTSLLSALGIREMTQLAKLHRASTFQTFETWNTVAFLYLVLIFFLQLVQKYLEKKLTPE